MVAQQLCYSLGFSYMSLAPVRSRQVSSCYVLSGEHKAGYGSPGSNERTQAGAGLLNLLL